MIPGTAVMMILCKRICIRNYPITTLFFNYLLKNKMLLSTPRITPLTILSPDCRKKTGQNEKPGIAGPFAISL
jgi:hypothetical protein